MNEAGAAQLTVVLMPTVSTTIEPFRTGFGGNLYDLALVNKG